MRKLKKVFILLVLLLICCGCSVSSNNCEIPNEISYLFDDEYTNFSVDKDKYQLKQVLILGRHNIRSPLSGNGSILNDVTNHEWFNWSSNASELSLRGGDLETQLGQYLRKYLVKYELMEENWIPNENEVRIYANSMQRTIATANYLISGLFPVANVDVEYHMDIGTMDPVFFPRVTFLSDKYLEQILLEADCIKLSELKDNYLVLEEMLDYEESKNAKILEHFDIEDSELIFELNEEPRVSGSLNIANSASDALKLQFYEEKDNKKAAFGHDVSIKKWLDICHISDVYQELLFCLPSVSINVAHPLLQEINSELNKEERKFTFLCGHDSNIGSVLAALDVEEYDLPNSLERKTPIGSMLVIEKWADNKTKEEYYSLCLQYQSLSQLKNRPLLDIENSPIKYHLSFNGLKQNQDGLYKVQDFQNKLMDSLKKYDELVSRY